MKNKQIYAHLQNNIDVIEQCFERSSDAVRRRFYVGKNRYPVYTAYMDSMINRDFVEGELIKGLMFQTGELPTENTLMYIKDCCMPTADVKVITALDQAVTEILSGNTVLFGENAPMALMINSKGFPNRGVSEAESEVAIRGPKDSFTESVRFNTVLIRRRIRDFRLKAEGLKIGVRSKTDVACHVYG